MTLGLVTDSNSQLPAALLEELDVGVVGLPVTIDGVEHTEGVDLDTDDFYRQLVAGAEVTTSQPSPGTIAATYQRLVDAGCDEIVSIHLGSALSGTVNSAHLAARSVDVEVHVVDTGQASFSVGLSVIAAAHARRSRGGASEVVEAAEWVAARVKNVFVMDGVALARASGRADVSALEEFEGRPEIPVMTFDGGDLQILGVAHDLGDAAAIMRDAVIGNASEPLRVGVGVADRSLFSFYDDFESGVSVTTEHRVEVVQYRCGPTVGAFTGAGTMGACWVPIKG